MPELPEVETIKLQLTKFLLGHEIVDVGVKNSKIFSGDPKKVVGAKIKKVNRFAKVISIDLSNGYSLLIHVKLTGQIIYRGPRLKNPPMLSKKVAGGAPGRNTHVVFKLDRGGFLYYNDIRRFGWIKIVESQKLKAESSFLAKLGPEPLDGLTLEKFREILGSTRRAVKVLLMDQAKIGGIGNIYANDALWLAGIKPSKQACTLDKEEVDKLYKAIEKVLKEGLKRGGASELTFVAPDGTEGNYQKHFLVYGQQGSLCNRCKKGKILKAMLGGRGTYYCPVCQSPK